MIGLESFKKILSSTVNLKPLDSSKGNIGRVQQDLRAWAATLSMKPEAEQCLTLERLLSELIVTQLPDAQRLDIMEKIYPSVARVVGQLHQHYIYEVSVITSTQQVHLNQVKSLYYLSILVYRSVIDRMLAQPYTSKSSSLLKFKFNKKTPAEGNELIISIYNACNLYLNLLMEQSVSYQRAPDLYWGELNYLYKLALSQGIHDTDVHKLTATNGADTIHDVYRQACLHSLLGLSSYRRQDIIGVHKLLPAWAKQVALTDEANPDFRLFVDLNDANPPIHLSPHTKINPYEADRQCLFLDLTGFESYLKQLMQQPVDNAKSTIQLRLAKMAWHTLHTKTGRREERKVSYDTATVVSGFNLIHYYLAGKFPLSKLINRHNLQRQHIPKYDTLPKEGYKKNNIDAQVMDTSTTGCRFKWKVDKKDKSEDEVTGANLQVLSLFAMQVHSADKNTTGKLKDGQWQLGLIRWVENREDAIEAGGRIIGYSATACGIRLDNKDNRSQDFVPALLIAGDERLGSKTTLLVPHYHFRLNDKVILRIGEKQTLLRLQHLLISSDDFEQYEIVRMT